MNEQKIINKQLIKNMLLNLVAFTIIFSFLGIIIFTQVSISLYKSSDEELLNNKNRIAMIQELQTRREEKDLEDIDGKPETRFPGEMQKANPRLVYIFRDENGNILEEEGNYHQEYFEEVKFNKANLDTIYTVTVNGDYQYRGINYQTTQDGQTVYVQALINVDAEQTIIKDFIRTLILSIIACIAISIIVSYILSKNALKPIVVSWKKQREFVQNASHELRTPLTILQAKQELLLEEPESKIVDKAEEIRICLNETRRLSKLVKDLMDLARADENKEQLKKETVDIDKFIKEVAEPFKELAKQQKKKFDLELNFNKEINIDKNKFHQLLIILLDNALKYTEEGNQIEVVTNEKDNKLLLEVKDTGIGISDEGLKHVFDRFYREDKARSRQTGGSGLGLSIAHYIVEQHKGTIKANHNKPKGTVFEILIFLKSIAKIKN